MLVFLKIGGSLITEKSQASKLKKSVLARLALEIHMALDEQPDLQVLLGHGSGSFGHIPAKEFNTRAGVHTQKEWDGFSQVWLQARTLNQHVMEALAEQAIPAVAISPFSSVTTQDGNISNWDLTNLKAAIEHNLVPVIYGDVLIDKSRGGTILSTEELFLHLATELNPAKVLIAGIEKGVYSDFPQNEELIPLIRPDNYDKLKFNITEAVNPDVTGGMVAKVKALLELIEAQPSIKALIFSGEEPGFVYQALLDQPVIGTQLHA